MSLVTRCPHCRTLYRVQPEQLQARGGRVRCGRCMNVFDGFGALAGGQDGAGSDPLRSDTQAATPAAAPPVASTVAQRKDAGASQHDAPGAGAAAAPAPAPALQTAPPPGGPSAIERMRDFAAPWRKPNPRARQIALCALLAFALAAQVAYAMRSELAARSALMKSMFEGVCGMAGCTLALPQSPQLVKIEASDVHMIDVARPQLIQLTATLRSYAGHDVAYPALDLVLTNANEHALARRIFLPADYLDAARDPAGGIAPGAEITVALDLDTGDLNAAGFRLDLVAAPAPATR